mmetsp:Transcript_25604/g.55081  ORF Transcript_25604/g.55081 Transcript_25604/m.55081 type:complete len:84 (+) Transcript_25604:12-263(+)
MSKLAVMRNATTKFGKEESALGTVQKLKHAIMKESLTKPGKDESVLGIGSKVVSYLTLAKFVCNVDAGRFAILLEVMAGSREL